MLKINPEKEFTPSFKRFLNYIHPDDVERVNNTVQTALKEILGFHIEYRILRSDQSTSLVHEQAGILLDSNGNLDGPIGFIQDVTNHKISDELLEKENQFKILYDNLDVGIWSRDVQKYEHINSSKGIEYITGYSNKEFKDGLQWKTIVHKEDLQQFLGIGLKLGERNIVQHQYRIVNKNGDIKWVQDYTIPSLDHQGNIVRFDGLTSDITEQKEMEEKIKFLANYDFLTKLPNRNKFIEKLDQLIDGYVNSNNQFAVLKLDIDGFKYVNNTLGNEIGDEVLKEVRANRKVFNLKDLIARRGGDEFVILIDKIESINSWK